MKICFVCIDTDNDIVNQEQGHALFDDNGSETNYLKTRTDHLLNVNEKFQQTNTIMHYLSRKRLLILKALNINLGDEKKFNLNGLYGIDEKKLNDLPDTEFNELRNKGLLPIIYAHLSSMHQIARLAKNANCSR